MDDWLGVDMQNLTLSDDLAAYLRSLIEVDAGEHASPDVLAEAEVLGLA